MLEILYSDEFQKRYQQLPETIQRKAERQEHYFRDNPFHPSLHTEKLKPRGRELWSFRIDKDYRIIFRFLQKNTILFLTVGHHHWIYRI